MDNYCSSCPTCGSVKLVSIRPGKRLYHFMGLPQFIAWVESGLLTLRLVKEWSDTWEQPFRRIRSEAGELGAKSSFRYDSTYGHCWTQARECDAMWRLYCPQGSGVRIGAVAADFARLGGVMEAVLAPVMYTNEPVQALLRKDDAFPAAGYVDAFVKRAAFRFEREVRLAVISDQCVENAERGQKALQLPLRPADFIRSVTLDPRADRWLLDTLRRYCARAQLGCLPTQSGLCSDDAFEAGMFPTTRRGLI